MAGHLHITVRFLSAEYHGALWPPAPATLFQALVSGGRTGAAALDWDHSTDEALQWLERLPPPAIAARLTAPGAPYKLFVPNNNLDKAAQSERAGGKTVVKPETLRTSKLVSPHHLSPRETGDADLVYDWQIPDGATADAARHAKVLDRLTARLTALGWGVDFAAAQAALSSQPHQPPGQDWGHYVPAPRGETVLQSPAPGVLAGLESRFALFRSRISPDGLNPALPSAPFQSVAYRSTARPPKPRSLAFDLRRDESKWRAVAWPRAMHVAGWLRFAAAEALREEGVDPDLIASFIQGHTAPEETGHRLSYLPLPAVGARFSDGLVRRALVLVPANLSAEESEAVSLLSRKLPGSWIFAEGDPDPIGYFARPQDPETVYPFYTGAAAVWETVTPIVLHGYNSLRGRISIEKTERLIVQALTSSGVPVSKLADIRFQPAPFWNGAAAAAAIFVPKHLEKWPRLHVRLTFRQEVDGPLAAGLGRHYGIGLFAARRS